MNYEDTTHNETPSCPYELTYLVRAEEESALLRRLFEVHGISLEREEQLSKIQLAYPIKGELYAFMGGTRFSASPSALQTLQAALRLEKGVLRYLLLHPAPSAPNSAPGRGRPFGGGTSGRASFDANRAGKSGGEPTMLSNEALEKKIEEILQ